MNNHAALVAKNHELVACLDNMEASATALVNECLESDHPVYVVNTAADDAACVRLARSENLVHPCTHGRRLELSVKLEESATVKPGEACFPLVLGVTPYLATLA